MIRRLFSLFALCASVAQLHALDVGRMADALAMKETGRAWDGRPGSCGELSEYQLTAGVWRQQMADLPFEAARDPALARACALKHVRWLVTAIEQRGLNATPQRVATAWHFGITKCARRTQWGAEVANLYFDLP